MLDLKNIKDGMFSSIIYCVIWLVMAGALLITPAGVAALWIALLLFGGSVFAEFTTACRKMNHAALWIINFLGSLVGFFVMAAALLGLLDILTVTAIEPERLVMTLTNGSRAMLMRFSVNMLPAYWLSIAIPPILVIIRLIFLAVGKSVLLRRQNPSESTELAVIQE